jgi:CBS domain containing-hemolysin-like protein
LLNTAGNLTLSSLGIRPAPGTHLVHSVEELKLMVIASQQAGLLSEQEEGMIDRLLDFSEVRAHHIMVPRTEMMCVSLNTSPDELFSLVSTSGFDRYPVFEDNLDNIVGIVHARDILRLMRGMRHRPHQPPVTEIMREPLVLPESLVAEDLLAELRTRRSHLAILVDEYGGTAGLVTLDDILRYVVGEVRDEFDVERPEIQAGPAGVYLVDGLLAIEDVNERLGLKLDSDEFDTIGGLLLGQLGRRPTIGDQATVDGTVMRVDELDGLRISLVRISAAG